MGRFYRQLALLVVFVALIVFFLPAACNSYVGWYSYRSWENRLFTQGTGVSQSVKRDVFVQKLNFSITPDSLMTYYSTNDTIFYLEKAFRCGVHSSEKTVILTDKETAFPYQLGLQIVKVPELKKHFSVRYWHSMNTIEQDSVSEGILSPPMVMLRSNIFDTLYFKLISWDLQYASSSKVDTIGIVKVFP